MSTKVLTSVPETILQKLQNAWEAISYNIVTCMNLNIIEVLQMRNDTFKHVTITILSVTCQIVHILHNSVHSLTFILNLKQRTVLTALFIYT